MTDTRNGRGFATGLFGGAALGTIAGLFFAPQAYAAFTKLRNHMSDSVADAGRVATGAYRDATSRARSAVDDLEARGRDAYGHALSAVARGAADVAESATQARATLDETTPNT